MSVFYRLVHFLLLVAIFWTMGIASVWAAERKVHYRYKNKYYTDSKTKLCGNKEDALRLAKEMERKIREGITKGEFRTRYENSKNLKEIYPRCTIHPKTKSIPIEIIPTTGTHFGVLYEIVYDPDEEGITDKLYSVYIKSRHDLRYYDSQEQLIGLIESGEIDWAWLSDIEKQAIWDSLDDSKAKRLEEVLDARSVASLPNLLNESFAMLSSKDSSPWGDAVLRERTPLVEVGGYLGEQPKNSSGAQ